MTPFTFFTFFFLLFHSTSIYASRTPTNATASTETPPTTIKMKLIPRHSIFPPTIAIVKSDYNEYDYENDESVQAFLSPVQESNIFLASIQIGEPPVAQLMVPDTGSSLTFVKSTLCIGCDEGSTILAPYDPSASSTYRDVSCNSDYCQRVKGSGYGCGTMSQCTFSNRYGSGHTIVKGDLGTEKLRFLTYDQGITTIPDAVVGCTISFESRSKSAISGVLGLGYDKVSILKKMATPKFSYCVGSIFDGDYKYNHIILGKGAKMLGYSTPLSVPKSGHYFLTLEGISVGSKRLDIDPEIFKPTSSRLYSGGVVIDSGTSLIFLKRKAYEALKFEIKNRMEDFEVVNDKQMCYEGLISDVKGFPVVTFHFAQEAVLLLDVESIFFPYRFVSDIFCLAVRPSDSNNFGSLTIIGMLAQQKHNVAYDLTQMRLYIDRIDCQFVDD